MTAWGIIGSGSHLPEPVVDNHAVAASLEVGPDWIATATGILERRRAAPHEAASDLGAHAARAALADAGADVADVGLIVVGTTTPDEISPSTACRIQALLGARGAVAFDLSAACSGYLFGLETARNWLAAHPGEGLALVIGAEVFSRFLDPADRRTAVLFGDGAGASVIGPVPDGTGIEAVWLGSDGTHADDVHIPAGGSRRPADTATVGRREHYMRMDAKAIRSIMPEVFADLIAHAKTAHGIELDDLDLIVPHQPNPRSLHLFADAAGIPRDKLVVIGEHLGNIGTGSIPTALVRAAADGRLRPGHRVLLIAIGAGLTWGGVLMRWAATGKGP